MLHWAARESRYNVSYQEWEKKKEKRKIKVFVFEPAPC